MGSNPAPELPFHTLYIDNSTSLESELNTVFKRKKNIVLVDGADKAEAVLKVYSENTQKDLSVINRGGSAKEYLLVLSVEVQLLKNGVSYGPPMDIVVRRTYAHSDSQVLGKVEEETLLWQDMRQDVAEQIIRRLSYLKPHLANTVPASEPESN